MVPAIVPVYAAVLAILFSCPTVANGDSSERHHCMTLLTGRK